jgi:hypothetical protein
MAAPTWACNSVLTPIFFKFARMLFLKKANRQFAPISLSTLHGVNPGCKKNALTLTPLLYQLFMNLPPL